MAKKIFRLTDQCSVFAIRAQHPIQQRVMDVQVRVVIPRVVLEEAGHREVVRIDPAAGDAAVVPDPGVLSMATWPPDCITKP